MSSESAMSVFAMASAPNGAAGYLQFLPFAIILAIFYFLILLPMKRRQTKIQEFHQTFSRRPQQH